MDGCEDKLNNQHDDPEGSAKNKSCQNDHETYDDSEKEEMRIVDD